MLRETARFAWPLLVIAACGARTGLFGGTEAGVADAGQPDTMLSPLDAGGDTSLPVDSTVDVGAGDDASIDAASDVVTIGDGSSSDADAAGTVLPPSCASGGAGMTNCGATAENCCVSPLVNGGTFFRTYSNDGGGPGGEADPASVSTFRLDKYLVTVGRFRQFVQAWDSGSGLEGGAGYFPPSGSGKHAHLNGGLGLTSVGPDAGAYETGWDPADDPQIAPTYANLVTYCFESNMKTWTTAPGSQENLPINCVNWWEAYAFCIWDGGFLPTETEWEYAAAGGAAPVGQREYPWGSTPPGTANQYLITDCNYGSPGCYQVANIAPVGTAVLGAGLWGQLDLVGEMSEYELDWWNQSYVNPCIDCAYLPPPPTTTPPYKSFRGGAFGGPFSAPPFPWLRSTESTGGRDYYAGFRCARSP